MGPRRDHSARQRLTYRSRDQAFDADLSDEGLRDLAKAHELIQGHLFGRVVVVVVARIGDSLDASIGNCKNF